MGLFYFEVRKSTIKLFLTCRQGFAIGVRLSLYDEDND